jgi:uncharacterized RDD family membrane protein YckC
MAGGRRGSLRVVTRDSAEVGSPYPNASLLLRGLARLIDVIIAAGLYTVAGSAGATIALLFLLFSDGLLQGQSAGKRIMGVKVVYLPTRTDSRFRDSVLRNGPFGLVVLFGMMPSPLGGVAFFAGAVLIGGVEAYRAIRDPLGLRLGDIWAQTQVVDGKVVAGSPVLSEGAEGARAPSRVMLDAWGDQNVAPRGRTQCESR